MVMCFSVLTAAVVLAALLRSRKGKKTAGLISVWIILLFIVSIIGITFAANSVWEFGKILPILETIAAVLQLAALIFALLKSNGDAEKHSIPVSGSNAVNHPKTDAQTNNSFVDPPKTAAQTNNSFVDPPKTAAQTNNGFESADIQRLFNLKYAPYLTENFKDEPRDFNDIPPLDPPQRRNMALAVDAQRAEHPYVGADMAAKEIFLNLTNWLNGEKGVHAETLLAVLGSIGGRECCRGIITALKALAAETGSSSMPLGALTILIVDTKNGEKYVMGDKIANEFCSFYMTAAKDNTYPFEVLKPLAEKCASTVGTEEYWNTPFGEYVSDDPKALADCFEGKFEVTFATYCRYPHERMMAMALAAQKAVDEAVKFMPKDRAMSILAEFGWRTSHYIGKEL